jgi:hypothetical protein
MKQEIKNQSQTIIGITISAIIFFGFCITVWMCEPNLIKHSKFHKYTSYEIYTEMNQLRYDSIKLKLIDEVDDYIHHVASSSALNGFVIVEKCIEYDIDICFVLAQGEIESHFGTMGLARKTNSVFNVFAFDGHDYDKINANGKYAHPNDCVEPYLNLLKRDYLVNGKTEYDMLIEFTNKDGKRYATNEQYETNLLNKMTKIKNVTTIDSTYQELKKHLLIIGI